MRQALRSLTLRGRGLLAIGLGIGVGSALSGQRDLLRIAILLLVLPFVAAYLAARTHFRLGAERTVTPHYVPVGTVAEVELTITNLSQQRSGTLLLSDFVPAPLGHSARRVLERVEPQGMRTTTYPLHASRRGRFEIGPLSVTAVDPFGLVRLTRSFQSTDGVLVVPRVVDLPDAGLRADHRGRGDGAALTMAARGQDDVVPREYRIGDDLRRIHWRASARADDLMVRREEVPWTNHATVLLDLRGPCHAGSGPHASVEVMLSAGASAAVHLIRRGWQVRVATTDGRMLVSSASGSAGEAAVLEALALATPSPTLDIDTTMSRDDLVIAVITADPRGAQALSGRAARRSGQLGIALVLDTAAWSGDLSTPASGVAASMSASGWRTGILTADESSLTQAWTSTTAEVTAR